MKLTPGMFPDFTAYRRIKRKRHCITLFLPVLVSDLTGSPSFPRDIRGNDCIGVIGPHGQDIGLCRRRRSEHGL